MPDALRTRMLAGAPVRERRVALAGASTALLEGGDGPPLVLLHGGIECGGPVWAPALPRLAETHSLVVPDLPGLGESEPLERLDAGGFAAWFGDLIEETCAEAPTVVAHSLGGTLVARFAAELSLEIDRLVLCGAPCVGPYRMPLKLRLVAIRFSLRPTERNGRRFERFALLDRDRTRERDPEWFDSFSAHTAARAKFPHVKRTMRQLIGDCAKQVPDSQLRRIACPTSLVWGRGDRMVPVGLAEDASTRLGWPLQVMEGTAHAPQIERPDAFSQLTFDEEEVRR